MSPLTKDTCSPCLRGQHVNCTTPDACKCVECYPPPAPKFVWEEPPEGRGKYQRGPLVEDDVLAELRSHPKRWARVKSYASKSGASAVASKVRKGLVTELPATEWESTARVQGKGSALYLRYVGEAS